MLSILPRSIRFAGLAACLVASSVRAEPALVEVFIGPHLIVAELALGPAERERGLMFRESLPEGRGMLFAFPDDGRHCMWMRNTQIPLSVAFVDADGVIVRIAEMAPLSDATHCSEVASRYALEMPGGWFAARSVGPGERLIGLEQLPPAR